MGEDMTPESNVTGMSGRALAQARRQALSGAGKAAIQSVAAGPTRREAERPSDPQASLRVRAAPVSAPPIAPEPGRAPVASRRAAVPAPPAPSANAGRAAALARRKAMSSKGKVVVNRKDRVRDGERTKPVDEPAAAKNASRKDGNCSCGAKDTSERGGSDVSLSRAATPSRGNGRPKPRGPRRNDTRMNPGRAASLARRQAQSSRGKAGVGASGLSAAQTARAANPELSGRELAKALREQRSRRGGAGRKQSAPTGRARAARTAATPGAAPGAAQDAPWKVGASETSHGQTVTGTMVGRSRDMTGDEASTCRTVTGTEYMGADIFRDFCQGEPPKAPRRVGVSPTNRGNPVTGNQVGRSTKVTGDEPGTCQQVTGTEYMGANLQEAFCGRTPEKGPAKSNSAATRGGKRVTGNNVGRSGKVTGDEVGATRSLTGTQYMQPGSPAAGPSAAPPKVGTSATLLGGTVTGTMIGRHPALTGDEAGSCRNVTGDDYIGLEQFGQFCEATPARTERKVGVSATLGGERITGTMTGRASRMTGDEPGTCRAVTGTPYAGAEQYSAYCEPTQASRAAARMQPDQRRIRPMMTGIQPGVGGRMTGDAKGACEPVTGTPYSDAGQVLAVCAAEPAEPGSPDFPQPLPSTGEAGGAEPAPWSDFSIASPAHASNAPQPARGVTGAPLEGGRITGPFGMASGKVTGIVETGFGRNGRAPLEADLSAAPPTVHGRVKSRISGEGINDGITVTGDDWDPGDRVTGTAGTSAPVRNPSRRGAQPLGLPMAAAMAVTKAATKAKGRAEGIPEPVSKVTGGSGNTDKGALVTYSGGARG